MALKKESPQPHWIGSPRGIPALNMTCTVRLQYSQPGLRAPVYVVTSMSDPQWAPLEMDYRADDQDNLIFFKDFNVSPGKHQYKFRLGPGDWWALDESKPSVHDDAGNRNNLIVVDSPSDLPSIESISLDHSTAPDVSTPASTPVSEPDAPLLKHETFVIDDSTDPVEHGVPPPVQLPAFRHENLKASNAPSVFDSDASSDQESDTSEAPMLRHESFLPQKSSDHVDSAYHSQDIDDHAPPLFSHESFISSDGDDDDDDESHFVGAADPGALSPTFDPDSHHDHGAPLLRHEISLDIDDTPLFRHESMFMNSTFDASDDPADLSPDHDKELAALEDSGVHVDQFPTEREKIMRHLARVSTRLPEDEITFHSTPPSSPITTDEHFRRRSSSLRTSITTDSFSQLEPIKEAEEPRSTTQPSYCKGGPSDNSPTDLLTPPMTPDLGSDDCIDKLSTTLGSIVTGEPAVDSVVAIQSAEDAVSKTVADVVPATLSTRAQNLLGGIKKRVSSLYSRTFLAVIVGIAAAIAYKWQSLRAAVATRALRTFYPYARDINLQHRPAA